MHILVIVAGTNEPGNSNVLADAFMEGIRSVGGATVEKVRLKDLRIEHFSLKFYEPLCISSDDFCRLQEQLVRAQGLVFASPIWNFSVPAHLKNVIDRMGAFALDSATHAKGQLNGLPFYMIFAGGAPMIAWKALMNFTTLHISEALKYYGGTVIGRHFEPRAMPGKGQFGLVVDRRPESLARMRSEGARFAAIVRIYAQTGRLPLKERLRHGFFTWAYRVVNRIMYPLSAQQ